MGKHFDTVVLGAGLTGLTSAYYLNKAGKNILLIDTNSRVGGVIETQEKDGFLFEKGPNTGILGSVEIAELLEELSPDCEIEYGNENVSKRFILKGAKWEQLPSSLKLGVTTPLFTLKDKFRILGEPFRKPGTNPNETLAELVKRRMGQSFLDYAIDPFILGVYAGDPGYLVPKYALPKLYNLEQDFGSFIGGSIKKKFKAKDPNQKKANRKIFTIKGGLCQLTTTLKNKIGDEKFALGVSNMNIEPVESGYKLTYKSAAGELVEISSDKVLSTIPAFEIKKIMPFIDKPLLNDLQNVYYAPVIEVAVGFNKWEGIELDGFGGLIPHKEKREILGVMYMSSLFSNRAPKGGALISVFIGGARRHELTELSDDKVKELVAHEFKELMGVDVFNPDLFEISKHNRAIPQYGVESEARFDAVDKIQEKYKGLFIAGNLHQGIGMADRVKQARLIVEEIKE